MATEEKKSAYVLDENTGVYHLDPAYAAEETVAPAKAKTKAPAKVKASKETK